MHTVASTYPTFVWVASGGCSNSAGPACSAARIIRQLMPLQAGTRLGPYEVVALIGAGGMGEVWLATELRLGRKVALKLLPPDLTRDPDRILRFEHEARAASALNHPNVCTIYALDQTSEGQHYIAMEYVEGDTLRRRLTTSRLTVAEALDIAIQVAAALSVAHAAGIIHRDIKPENVMLRPDGVVKVLDFGLAKLAPAISEGAQTTQMAVNTDAGTVVGTAAYMSPEQTRGEQLDARTDVFSLGVVLYEMATGVPPFRGKTSAVIFEAILNRAPLPAASLRPELPAGLDGLIAKALEKDRDIRYQSVRELLVDLRRLKRDMDSGPGHAEPHTNVGPARPWWRRRSGATVITVVLAFLLTTAWLAVNRRAEPTSPPVGPMRPTPLTTLPGLERSPSFSPDGNQIAFSWDGDTGNEDIYVKLVGAGSPLRLTTSAAPDVHPAWSPNGLYIAFVRIAEDDQGGIFIISALGGPERRIDPVKWEVEWDLNGAGLSWSPDGRYLAFSDRSAPQAPVSLFIISVEQPVRRKLTSPPALSIGDLDPEISADGHSVAFIRATSRGVSDIYRVPFAGGEPTRLTTGESGLRGLTWTPDDTALVYSSSSGGALVDGGLWSVPAAGGSLNACQSAVTMRPIRPSPAVRTDLRSSSRQWGLTSGSWTFQGGGNRSARPGDSSLRRGTTPARTSRRTEKGSCFTRTARAAWRSGLAMRPGTTSSN